MKITIVYRYFWPDTPPYATMLKTMSQWFVEAGHDVEVITAQPAYKPKAGIPTQPKREIINGAKIRRVGLLKERGSGIVKLINAPLFIMSAFFILLFGKKRDLIWTATIPPVLQAFAIMGVSKIKNSMFLYHMQDIYPEIATVSGHISKMFPVKLFKWLDRFTQKRSDAIVVLGQDMHKSILSRGVDIDNVSIINNFSLILSDRGDERKLANSPSKSEPVKFIFAGNVGRFQNLTALVKAFSLVTSDEAVLNIIGDGRAKTELVSYVEEHSIKNIFFKDHMAINEVFQEMRNSHVGVVSLSPDIFQYAFPSKVLTYMAANLPMLAMVETESDLAQILDKRNLGVSVDWNSPSADIETSIRELIMAIRQTKMSPAKAIDIYHPNSARDKWLSLLNDLATSRGLA